MEGPEGSSKRRSCQASLADHILPLVTKVKEPNGLRKRKGRRKVNDWRWQHPDDRENDISGSARSSERGNERRREGNTRLASEAWTVALLGVRRRQCRALGSPLLWFWNSCLHRCSVIFGSRALRISSGNRQVIHRSGRTADSRQAALSLLSFVVFCFGIWRRDKVWFFR